MQNEMNIVARMVNTTARVVNQTIVDVITIAQKSQIMKYFLTLFILTFFASMVQSQTHITGVITNMKNEPLPGANVMVKGSIDGASSDTLGRYSFSTRRKGEVILLTTYIGFEPCEIPVKLNGTDLIADFRLREQSASLADVVITAGSFEASDKKKGVTLKPLDILTTASAAGDIYGALSTLPGTSVVGEDGRLFVRGGDAYETNTYIDGMRVKKPYSSTTPDLPSRGRFSPQLFTGTTFSSGGYSAQYGEALSSALILNTTGLADGNQWGLGLMALGTTVSKTWAGDRASGSIGAEYYDLKLYNNLVKQRVTYDKDPLGAGCNFNFRQRTGRDGLLRVMGNASLSRVALWYPDYDNSGVQSLINLDNDNVYLNSLWTTPVGNGWDMKLGQAFSYDNNRLRPGERRVDETDLFYQGKLTFRKEFTPKVNLLAGADISVSRFVQEYSDTAVPLFRAEISDQMPALFAESEVMVLRKIAIRAGLRGEWSPMLGELVVNPRFSAAWLVGEDSQISLSSGIFNQKPQEQLLRFTKDLSFERAEHYILNYQIQKDNRIFRVEVYQKNYSNLVCYDGNDYTNATTYNNKGNGYARGLEIFWRDQQTIKTLDYWVSYSYIDTRRLYRDFPAKVRPTFAPEHNFSLVAKWWVAKLNTQFGGTLSLASGRPYNDPSSSGFMDKITSNYFDISLNASYLFPLFGKTSVLYLSVSNITGQRNIFGYRYYQTPQGVFMSDPVKPEADRFFFIGVFINFS
ncbi:MAG TPA: TonB-dependent receptor [Bacteroidales bacterium]|nr:TonB-dependent receptor [Bacteroidales bacterium]